MSKVWMSMRQYATHKGVSAMAVSKAVAAGRIRLGSNGQIDRDQADIDWETNTRVNVSNQQAEGEQPPAADPQANAPRKGSLAHAQLVKESAKAKKAAFEVARLEGKYADIETVRFEVSGMVSAAKNRLRGIGNKVAQDLAAESDPVLIQTRIDKEIDEALTDISRWQPTAA